MNSNYPVLLIWSIKLHLCNPISFSNFSVTDDLKNLVIKLETRVSQLEKGSGGSAPAPAAPAKVEEEDDDDDDVDLFGSDSEDEEAKAEKVIRMINNKNYWILVVF